MAKRSISKIMIRGACGLVIAALGMALAWTVYSRLAVAQYKRQIISKGEILNIALLVPPAVDPDENAGPQLAGYNWRLGAQFPVPVNFNDMTEEVAPGKLLTIWQQPFPVVLDARNSPYESWLDWAKQYKVVQPVFAELRGQLQRPHMNNNLPYAQMSWTDQLPTMVYRRLSLVLAGAALSTLHEKDLPEARDNLLALLHLAILTEDEPLFATQMTGINMGYTLYDLTWHAMQTDGWTDNDLALLQQAWQGRQLAQALVRTMRMERAMGIKRFQTARDKEAYSLVNILGGGIEDVSPHPTKPDALTWLEWMGNTGGIYAKRTVVTLAVEAWRWHFSYSDELLYLKVSDAMVKSAQSTALGGPLSRIITLNQKTYENLVERGELLHLRTPLTHFGSYDYVYVLKRLSLHECRRQLAITAIALKRHVLRHGSLPERLQDLVPEWLPKAPRDPMNQQPLHYQKLTTHEYLLYSVGTNGRDDAGQAASRKRFARAQAEDNTDIVWPQAATTADLQTAAPK